MRERGFDERPVLELESTGHLAPGPAPLPARPRAVRASPCAPDEPARAVRPRDDARGAGVHQHLPGGDRDLLVAAPRRRRPARRAGGEGTRSSEATRSALAGALPDDAEQAATFGVLSLLIVLVSATSFSRALTRMYAKAWSVRGPGWRSPWRWFAAILAITSCTVATAVAQRTAAVSGGRRVPCCSPSLVNTVLWTWVPSVLLAAEVPWRYLAPGGALMGAATVALYFASKVYMPSAMSYADQPLRRAGCRLHLHRLAVRRGLRAHRRHRAGRRGGPRARPGSPVPGPSVDPVGARRGPADEPLIPHE